LTRKKEFERKREGQRKKRRTVSTEREREGGEMGKPR